ncbi:EAL domain-containing protein [Aciduricibacillus chroicocephali]|uniref:EAL domain-containing protein n=1 Tax=Aciduricibacillus chroicocephali TaxID=3054939 RepID=A0ABY9KSA9_9BACI|nr:EAL domain-containing protein [Bacillaceae bacterium 44XB]
MLLRNHDDLLLVKEEAVRGLYDYFLDHMDLKNIRFRLTSSDWQPFEEALGLLENRWIDKVISEELVQFHYQPIIDADKNIYAHEMLARFTSEDGAPVSPYEAFQSARSRNRTYALDRICRTNAVKQSGKAPEKVFINFIPTSIYSPEHCLRTTVQLAHSLNLSPSKFVFEVVETEKVSDMDHLKEILDFYREKGFLYALDDVGAGFNDADTIKELQPHYMKLDMKFVQGVSHDADKQKAALHILNTAESVGSITLAEGVEEEEDFIWLKNAGFKLFQGYLFGKPAPVPADSVQS